MRFALLLLLLIASVYAQYYDVSITHTNGSSYPVLVYDDNSTSYKDNSIENPDALLRVCGDSSTTLLNKWVSLAYADGFDGDYIILSHAPVQVTSVLPTNCAYIPLDIHSFAAWYPSIPYVFISDTQNTSTAERWKLSRLRGWFSGDFGVVKNQVGNIVNVTVANATDDNGAQIVPDVDFLVVGLVRPDFTTMDTVISSPNETDPLLSDGGSYVICVNGICPDLPPYVEILTPEPVTYSSGTIPFTYIMYDDDEIVACWYILDGDLVNMPSCDVPYTLNVGTGTHTLVLYGQDTTGNIGMDSVTFKVGAAAPPTGGGGTGIPVYQPTPPPPLHHFYFDPEQIWITIDYPKEGSADFELHSNAYLSNVQCFVKGDFAKYTIVELADSSIQEGGILKGTIRVIMSPTEILDYDGRTSGTLHCTALSDPTLTSSALASVFLDINLPALELENRTIEVITGRTFEIFPGELINDSTLIWNVGEYNSTAINISAVVLNYPGMIEIFELPERLGYLESGKMRFNIFAEDYQEGEYIVYIDLYENGRKLGQGHIMIRVLKYPPGYICRVPDLVWTVWILIAGIVAAIYIFRKKWYDEERKFRLDKLIRVDGIGRNTYRFREGNRRE